MLNVIELITKLALKDSLHDGFYVDFNTNNYYATLNLAQYASEGKVLSFVTGKEEVEGLCALLESNFQDNVRVISDKFSHIDSYADDNIDGIFVAIDKPVDTNNLIAGLIKGLGLLSVGGRLMFSTLDDKIFREAKEAFVKMNKRVYTVIEFSSPCNEEIPKGIFIERLCVD